MSTYTVTLTPTNVSPSSEGSLDTALVGGLSIQRTMNALMIKNGTDYKMVGQLKDGDTFTDTINGIATYPDINGNDIDGNYA
jgi:hypothetical protein